MVDDEPTIEPGWVAYGSDGERIGEVDDVAPDYVLVSKGRVFPRDLLIPTSAIGAVDPEAGVLRLKVTAEQVEGMGRNEPPLVDTAFGQGVTQTGETRITEGLLLDQGPRVNEDEDDRRP
jgi:hypothetical protein